MKKAIVIVSAIIFCFAACDKIDPSEDGTYTVESGAEVTVEEGTSVSDHTHRVWIEKYTGPRCNNCPDADTIIHDLMEQASYKDKVVATSIHTNSFGVPISGSPDFRTPEGQTWSETFGIENYPSVMLNRQSANNEMDIITDISTLSSKIDQISNTPADIAIAVSCSTDPESGKLNVTTALELLNDIEGDITLTVFIIEDALIAAQRYIDHSTLAVMTNSTYVHNHVLRKLVTDLWGQDVEIGRQSGTTAKATLQTDMPDNLVAANCHIVAFVSDKSSRSIYNVATCPIL